MVERGTHRRTTRRLRLTGGHGRPLGERLVKIVARTFVVVLLLAVGASACGDSGEQTDAGDR